MPGAVERTLERLRLAKASAVARIGAVWTLAKNAEALQLLDLLKPFGVAYQRPARTWQRPFWGTLHALSVWQFGTALVNLVNVITHSSSTSVRAFHTALVMGMMLDLAVNLVLQCYAKSMQQARDFIEGRLICSEDASHDTGERKVLARRSRISVSVMLLALVLNQILFLIPNSELDKLFRDPVSRSLGSGSIVQRVARFLFLDSHVIVWMSKYLWAFGSVSVLLLSLRSEQRILAHRFENDLQRMKSRMTNKHFDSSHHFYRWQARDTFWKQMKADVSLTLEQHIDLVRIIQLLKSSIGTSFLCFYIYAVIGFGATIFVIMSGGLSLLSAVLVITIAAIALQGSWWCWLIESIQDTNENIHETVYEMSALLPYDAEHCNSYRQMRSSLMTIAIYLANGGRIRCAGIHDITIDLFAKTVKISYETLKFLMGLRR